MRDRSLVFLLAVLEKDCNKSVSRRAPGGITDVWTNKPSGVPQSRQGFNVQGQSTRTRDGGCRSGLSGNAGAA